MGGAEVFGSPFDQLTGDGLLLSVHDFLDSTSTLQ
jgi:hypothetical protein